MRIPLLTVFLTVFLLPLSTAAHAGDGDFRCPGPGARIDTSAGGHLVADSATGFDCRMLDGVVSFTMHAGFANLKSPAEFKEAAEKLWPLQVGKESEYTSICDNSRCVVGRRYHNRMKVAGMEAVTIPAGTFRAYKITMDVTSFDEDDKAVGRGDSYQARTSFWWAPSIGYTVRYEWKFLAGFTYSSDRHWEAMSIQSGALAANKSPYSQVASEIGAGETRTAAQDYSGRLRAQAPAGRLASRN
jgi:hypothetical protein